MIPVERGWSAFCILAAAGFFSTLLSIAVFRRFTNREQFRAAVNRVLAHLLEFRLFSDEPRLLLHAQRDLFTANARLLKQAALPSLILLLPFALLFTALDAFFAHAPLPQGQTAVVTTSGIAPVLPARLRLDSPPVHIPRLGEVSWRIRAIAPVSRPKWPASYDTPALVFHHHWLFSYLAGAALLLCSRALLGFLK